MRWFLRGMLVLAFAALPLCAAAQHVTESAVVRVTKVRILPGKTDDFYRALNWNVKVLEAAKESGLIVSYSLFRSVTYEGADKYDVGFTMVFRNMAALDGFNEKAEAVSARVYGTAENRAAIARLRAESWDVVSSELERTIELTGK